MTFCDPSPNAATELVQLRQPEPLRVLDDHHAGVGNVDTDLDHRRCHQNIKVSGEELPHYTFFFSCRELPVDETDPFLGEDLGREPLVFTGRRQEVDLLGLVDERVDDVCLTASCDLGADEVIDGGPTVRGT